MEKKSKLSFVPFTAGIVSQLCVLLYYITVSGSSLGLPTMPWANLDYDILVLVWLFAGIFGFIFGLCIFRRSRRSVIYHIGMILCIISMVFIVFSVYLLYRFMAG